MVDDHHPSYDELAHRADGPQGTAWGLYGPGDQIGSLNRLTPDRRRAGAACVRLGHAFNLDLPIGAMDPPVPGWREPPRHVIFGRDANHRDDYLERLYLQGSTQVDGLRHMRDLEHGFYNHTADADVNETSPVLGIGRLADAGIAGRGVLLDVARHLSRVGTPPDHHSAAAIDVSVLDDTAAAQGVRLERGDILLLRTGWLGHYRTLSRSRREQVSAHPRSTGLVQSEQTVRWLWDRGPALVAADNLGIEVIPAVAGSPFGPLPSEGGGHASGLMHRTLIARLGFVLGELWDLDDLAAACDADGVYTCLVTVKPLNLPAGVGSPANAMAIR